MNSIVVFILQKENPKQDSENNNIMTLRGYSAY